MVLATVLDALGVIQGRLRQFAADPQAIEKDADDKHRQFLGFLTEACNLVRSRDTQDPGFGDAVSKSSEIINEAVRLAYEKLDFNFLPSFAHSAEFPVLKGPHRDENVFSHRSRGVLELIDMKPPDDPSLLPRLPNPWNTTLRPHPLSSPLSRFEGDAPRVHEPATPLLGAMYDARCEISSSRVDHPTGLTNNGSCLMVTSMGGWKNRSPILTYYLLHDAASQFPLNRHHADVGLTEVAWTSATDESRKLMFIADTWRVKSYAWAHEQSGEIYDRALPTHTLHTGSHHGPFMFSPLAVSFTHGPDGKARIGHKLDTSDSWRDEDNELEESSGSDPTGTISLADPQLEPAQWHAHPSAPATMLCGIDVAKSNDYSCISLDLEYGGRTVSRYIGHGGETRAFSASAGDPNVFLTAASDGQARLYDRRVTLPVLTLRAGSGEDDCAGVVLVHPGGVPTVFTGAAHDQVIRLWDVHPLSTSRPPADRLGGNFDYRRAKIPHFSRNSDGDEEDEDEWGSDDDEAPCWPKKAEHAEDYFGHLFDAGNRRILRYAFKEQPDLSILPEYGEASLNTEW
ncbi:hypothetical protein DFH09DRAFT_1407418 [Mycena vulgaris]|nr:hypothetical protein DFH09DRAFT_1407418 [Mycena vulgaris]